MTLTPMFIQNIGLPGILLIAVVVLVLFGRGKISSLMGEVGKGITSFKKGVNEGKEELEAAAMEEAKDVTPEKDKSCLLYTSPSPRDKRQSRMPSSA